MATRREQARGGDGAEEQVAGQVDEKSVSVRFDSRSKQFDIRPETLRFGRKGRIKIDREPADAGWKLVDVTFQDGKDQFTKESESQQTIIVRNEFLRLGDFCYTVTVADEEGRPHVSPDPHIRNENPGTP